MLLPEAGRAVRRRSKSENSSASVSKPPTTVRGSRWHSASPGPRRPDPSHTQGSAPLPSPPPVPAVPLVLGFAGDPPQGSEKAGAGAQGSEAGVPLTGAPPGAGRRRVRHWHSPLPPKSGDPRPRAQPFPPSPHSPIPEATSSPTTTSPPPPGLHTAGRGSHHQSPPKGRVLVLLQPQGPGSPPKGQRGALQGQQASRGPQRLV